MKVTATDLPEVVVLEPSVFRDERGWFFESHNREVLRASLGIEVEFVQDNHSCSARGVVRGLHFQRAPHAQGKLVRVSTGRAFDVAVDIRPDSPRFGRWTAVELCAETFRQIWIPAGFAHGFLALEEGTEVQYKATAYYDRDSEACILWNDPAIGIPWPLSDALVPVLSAKDAAAPRLADALLGK